MKTTISSKKYKYATEFISDTVEPKIQELIARINEFLEPKGIVLGVELKWFIDEIEKE